LSKFDTLIEILVMVEQLGVDNKKLDIQVSERNETPSCSYFLGARPYIWRSCLKKCCNAVDRITMPLLGACYVSAQQGVH